jgi:dCTP deaminase
MQIQLEENYGVLSDIQIIDEMKKEHVFIYPFEKKNLSNTSYDVTLGPNYYRATTGSHNVEPSYLIPWDDESVHQYWGQPQYARTVNETTEKLLKLPIGAQYILLEPGELILAHTNEFIGTLDHVTTMMKARSSMGRVGISVCKDAGWGDVGYYNRWTMEISNFSQSRIPLVVGSRVAQIVFFYTGNVSRLYTETANGMSGAYQTHYKNVEKIIDRWVVSDMLPRYRF